MASSTDMEVEAKAPEPSADAPEDVPEPTPGAAAVPKSIAPDPSP